MMLKTRVAQSTATSKPSLMSREFDAMDDRRPTDPRVRLKPVRLQQVVRPVSFHQSLRPT